MTDQDHAELLTADELEAIELSAKLANALHKICFTPTSEYEGRHGKTGRAAEMRTIAGFDWSELAAQIHNIQHAVMAQAAARAYPDKFRLMGHIGKWR